MVFAIPAYFDSFYEFTFTEYNNFLSGLVCHKFKFYRCRFLFSINAIGMISSRFVMNRLVKRFGEFQMILINTIIFSGCVFLLTQVTSLYQLLIIAFPAGFAMGSVAPIINTYLILSVPGNKKRTANALYFSALDTGYGIGSVIWGFVAMIIYVQVFYLSAVLQVAAILLTVYHMRRSARSNSGIVLETKKQ